MSRKLKTILSVLAVLIAVEIALLIWYFVPSWRVASAFPDAARTWLVAGGTLDTGAAPRIVDGEVFLPFDAVKAYVDPRIWYDAKNSTVTVTTQDHVVRLQTEKLTAMINDKPVDLRLPVRRFDGEVYLPVSFLTGFYDIALKTLTYRAPGKDGAAMTVVTLDPATATFTAASPLKEEADVREFATIHAAVVQTIASGGTATVYGESANGKWWKVRTATGALGYVRKSDVAVSSERRASGRVVPAVKKPWTPADGRIVMAWDIIGTEPADTGAYPAMPGLDVISPTWFEMSTAAGELINRADRAYSDWAHARGMLVWATLTNDFKSPSKTHDFLTDSDAKDRLIRQVLAFAALYDLDGINIDFENVNLADRDALTQFAREIAPYLREQGLTVSMDVNIPGGSDNWSLCYDHEGLGEAVDYLALMAYDQYFASGGKAGSVAQITWAEENVRKVLEMVPASKLLLGVPLYTRVWKVVDGVDTHHGVMTMDNALKRIEDTGVTPEWDAESGQFRVSYVKDAIPYQFWLEDPTSMALRVGLVQEYGLAGAAAWSRSDGSDAIWQVFDDGLKKAKDYAAWKALQPTTEPVWKAK